MRIGVLGTGDVGKALAGRFTELGHDVLVGTRDPDATRARAKAAGTEGAGTAGTEGAGTAGTEGAGTAGTEGAGTAAAGAGWPVTLRLGTQSEAAAHGEIVVNATSGGGSLAALTNAGAANLAGKVLVDVSNPLDFSGGFPPSLLVKDTDSLAEQIQREFPDARVVKTLNTVNNSVMIHPERIGNGDHTMFVAGDDAGAKAAVTALLRELGWTDILDLGKLDAARGMEMLLPLWIRAYGAIGHGDFGFKLVQ